MSDRISAVFILGLLFLGLNACTAQAGPTAWRVEILKLPSSALRLFASPDEGPGPGRIRIKTARKGWYALSTCAGKPCVRALVPGYKRPVPPPNALADAEVTKGGRNIRAAWLAGPTRRYGHGVLGDAIEAERVVVEDRYGKRHQFTLPKSAVFEDRYARLADLDGDGSDEVIVVKSDLNRGAALAILTLAPDGLNIAGKTPAIGRANRWLNPAGIADYDGDNRNEIAIVVTPHIGGRLEFWSYEDRKLRLKAHQNGFSNHKIGSRAQRMSVTADFNGDGILDLALPSHDRKALRFISLASGSPKEVARISLPRPVVTEIIPVNMPDSRRPLLVMGLDGEQLAILR